MRQEQRLLLNQMMTLMSSYSGWMMSNNMISGKKEACADSWRVEDKFLKWGVSTGDEFNDWAIDAHLEGELRRLFLKELHDEQD